MKKTILLILMLLIWVTPSVADTYSFTTASADAAICARGCVFGGIVVATDATNPVTISFYDNTAASGDKFLPTVVITTSATDRIQAIGPPKPIYLTNGMYIDITTAGTASYTVLYR